MRTFITAFPIDKHLQQKLGIYDDQYVKSVSVGKVVHKLIEAGYVDIKSFIEMTGSGETRLAIHCSK
jgi:hypothetical protein